MWYSINPVPEVAAQTFILKILMLKMNFHGSFGIFLSSEMHISKNKPTAPCKSGFVHKKNAV